MNCKQGDLAIIVRGLKGFTSHAGKIVRVIDLKMPNHPKLGAIWNVELSRPIGIMSFKSHDMSPISEEFQSTICHCPDDWLRPLPGENTDEEILEAMPISARHLEVA